MKKNKKENTRKKSKKRIRTTFLVLCSIIIAGVLIFSNLGTILSLLGTNFTGELAMNEKYRMLAIKEKLYDDLDANLTFDNKDRINVLVFGMDSSKQRQESATIFRPDTIMLTSVDLNTQEISILSIPRDSRVEIYGRSGMDKVNSCFYYASLDTPPDATNEENFQAGIETLKGTISDLLGGIPIHYYVGVDMDGVPPIIDTLGGVEVDVHEDIYYKGTLRVEEGLQTLNGKQFLAYARCRNYVRGDIDRVEIQQKLIKALFKEATRTKNLMKLPSLISQTFDILETDIQFRQALSLAMTVKNFDVSKIKSATVPGYFQNLNGISYWGVNHSELQNTVDELF